MNEKTLMVSPIDEEKVIQFITKTIPLGENKSFMVSVGALLEDNVIVDEECCYQFMGARFHEGEVQLVYDVPVRIKTKTKQGESFPMTVDFYFPISAKKLKPFLNDKKNLKQFMGSRYNYNPRIIRNMKNFLEDVGSQLEKEEA